MDYGSGVFVALLIWLVFLIVSLVKINSQLERNLNKFGRRHSWLSLTAKPITPDDLERSTLSKILKFIFIHAVGFLSIFLSWLYVLWVVGFFIYNITQLHGTPQAVKEFRWKLKNFDLSLDQIIKEVMKIEGRDPSEFDSVKEEIMLEMRDRGIA